MYEYGELLEYTDSAHTEVEDLCSRCMNMVNCQNTLTVLTDVENLCSRYLNRLILHD